MLSSQDSIETYSSKNTCPIVDCTLFCLRCYLNYKTNISVNM